VNKGESVRNPGGGLRIALERTISSALACGALRPIETDEILVRSAGVQFLVRRVSSLQRKAAEKKRRRARPSQDGERPENPFLPPEPELTVAGVSPTHVAVLNKFNVLERHLLIVTRVFEHQETLLTGADFLALSACMRQIGGLGFYNGGTLAGASQPHKHLQLVPLPLASRGPALPMEPLIEGDGPICRRLPFRHAFARLTLTVEADPTAAAQEAHERYLDLLQRLGIEPVTRAGECRQSGPYNLLMTNGWMLLVPRTAECFRGISVNALGFAGSLFVKDQAQLELIRSAGPMRILTDVAAPRTK
jgi:ATP adenylyltransferase